MMYRRARRVSWVELLITFGEIRMVVSFRKIQYYYYLCKKAKYLFDEEKEESETSTPTKKHINTEFLTPTQKRDAELMPPPTGRPILKILSSPKTPSSSSSSTCSTSSSSPSPPPNKLSGQKRKSYETVEIPDYGR